MSNSRTAPPGTGSLEKGLDLLLAVVRDDGESRAAEIAQGLGIPPSSARRMLSALERRGLVARFDHGRYGAGGRLADLPGVGDAHRLLTRVARPRLRALARAWRGTAHLGIFDEGMVTYLVKEGRTAPTIFSREQGQLEAYCTGIGKVLLTHLAPGQLDAYLEGDFVRLTARTITDPDLMRMEVERIRRRGYAIDDREMAEDVFCVAVPLRDAAGFVVAAMSVTTRPGVVGRAGVKAVADSLAGCARETALRCGL